MAEFLLTLDGRRIDHLLRDPAGPVRRWLRRMGEAIADDARQQVGYDEERLATADRPHLQDVIEVREGVRGGDPHVRVGIWRPEGQIGVAWFHHQGTRPHHIPTVPKPGKYLVFRPKGSDKLVFVRQEVGVEHPGTDANRFLTDPAGRRVRLTIRDHGVG